MSAPEFYRVKSSEFNIGQKDKVFRTKAKAYSWCENALSLHGFIPDELDYYLDTGKIIFEPLPMLGD